jgi:hypothetical protein
MVKRRRHPKHPLAEVFGFPWDNQSEEATRHRLLRLCPHNNRVPSCTKDKTNDPLGVCSIYEDAGKSIAITCPVRLRQDWIIAEDAARFFFPKEVKWTSLTEVRLNDRDGQSAGNIDVVLVSYDGEGKILDFGAVEVQAVYISGNVRRPFEAYMSKPGDNLNWEGEDLSPRADYLSSSRKRLVPQLIYKGNILVSWRKKIAVVVHKSFFDTLPKMKSCGEKAAEIAWLVYDLKYDSVTRKNQLVRHRTCYTKLGTVLRKIATPIPGPVVAFQKQLQDRLNEQLGESASSGPTLNDLLR